METIRTVFWLELIMVITIPASALYIIHNRTKTEKPFGVRQIQFLGLITVAALVVILGMEGILEKSAVGALVGGLAGYLFGSFSKFDERNGG